MPEYIYGHWPVMEVLRSKRRRLEQLLIAERAEERGVTGEIMQIAKARDMPIRRVPEGILDDLARGGNHQSTIARVGEYPYVDVEDILQAAEQRRERPFLLLLDLLKDPQNVGVLLRIADAVGVHGVILQERRGVGVTPAVVNASSGAVEHLAIAQVTNLVSTMKELKKSEIWLVGMELGPELLPLDKADLNLDTTGSGAGQRGRRHAPPGARDMRSAADAAHAWARRQPERGHGRLDCAVRRLAGARLAGLERRRCQSGGAKPGVMLPVTGNCRHLRGFPVPLSATGV
jgi:23S rRNA (guanosine2251-2'-O)-methyltransferase